MKKILKPLLGLAIVIYVLRSKLVDFSALGGVVLSPVPLAIGLLFQTLLNFLIASRWFILCRSQALGCSWAKVFRINWISLFLSLVLPGSVGSDLVKGWYIVGESPQRRAVAALTIFVDRVVGSSTLFFIASATLLVFRSQIHRHHEMLGVATLVWGISAALVVGAIGFLVLARDRLGKPSLLESLLPARARRSTLVRVRALVDRLLQAVVAYRRQLPSLAAALVVSAAFVGASVLMYYVQSRILGIPVSLGQYFFIVPISSLVSYFSFLPLGLGVGQVVFYQLFAWCGVGRPELGATLCTLIQLHTLLFNLTGAGIFLRYRRQSGQAGQPARGLRRVV